MGGGGGGGDDEFLMNYVGNAQFWDKHKVKVTK